MTAKTREADTISASEKDQHDFLASLLKEARYGMIDFMFKQAAVLTLFIGWKLSSDDARKFIAAEPGVRVVGVSAVAAYALLLAFWAWTYRIRSHAAYRDLLKIHFMPARYYSPLLITWRLALSLVSAHFVLCTVLIMFLLWIR